MFLMKFCWHGSNFGQTFPAVQEYAFMEIAKNTPFPPLGSVNTKD